MKIAKHTHTHTHDPTYPPVQNAYAVVKTYRQNIKFYDFFHLLCTTWQSNIHLTVTSCDKCYKIKKPHDNASLAKPLVPLHYCQRLSLVYSKRL